MPRRTPSIITIIPMKSIHIAKSRLMPYLDAPIRKNLVLNMLAHVIDAAKRTSKEVWTIGSDPTIRQIARQEGAIWVEEMGATVNQTLRIAFEEVWKKKEAGLYLPGDLPFIKKDDIDELLESAPHRKNGVLVPSRSHGGTNAILLPKPSTFQPLLGPRSFHKHMNEARTLGLRISIHFSPGLAMDLDTWEDLRDYEALAPEFLGSFTRPLTTNAEP